MCFESRKKNSYKRKQKSYINTLIKINTKETHATLIKKKERRETFHQKREKKWAKR